MKNECAVEAFKNLGFGLSDYDALHSACKRDLIKEFVEECNNSGIVPFFYIKSDETNGLPQ